MTFKIEWHCFWKSWILLLFSDPPLPYWKFPTFFKPFLTLAEAGADFSNYSLVNKIREGVTKILSPLTKVKSCFRNDKEAINVCYCNQKYLTNQFRSVNVHQQVNRQKLVNGSSSNFIQCDGNILHFSHRIVGHYKQYFVFMSFLIYFSVC